VTRGIVPQKANSLQPWLAVMVKRWCKRPPASQATATAR
jgi:hypothetical protein